MFNKIIPILFSILLTGCWEIDHGEKRGVLVKLNSAGLFWKTREAELIRGGLGNGSGTIGKSFHFSIDRPELHAAIQKEFDNGEEVVIEYHCELFKAPWRGKTYCFLDGIGGE